MWRRSARSSAVAFGLVVVVALIAVSTGCDANVNGGDCSGGELNGDHCVPYTPAENAARRLAQMPIPPLHGHPLVNVTCRGIGTVVTCDGQTEDGRWIRSLRFRFDSNGFLEPVCKMPPEGRLQNIFCAV
jgi:hypothetical protein